MVPLATSKSFSARNIGCIPVNDITQYSLDEMAKIVIHILVQEMFEMLMIFSFYFKVISCVPRKIKKFNIFVQIQIYLLSL